MVKLLRSIVTASQLFPNQVNERQCLLCTFFSDDQSINNNFYGASYASESKTMRLPRLMSNSATCVSHQPLESSKAETTRNFPVSTSSSYMRQKQNFDFYRLPIRIVIIRIGLDEKWSPRALINRLHSILIRFIIIKSIFSLSCCHWQCPHVFVLVRDHSSISSGDDTLECPWRELRQQQHQFASIFFFFK